MTKRHVILFVTMIAAILAAFGAERLPEPWHNLTLLAALILITVTYFQTKKLMEEKDKKREQERQKAPESDE